VARRIAHEIKNPLTPIVLSAERLKRRFGRQITEGRDVFEQLVDTIIRQVGDLRRMVDEFSAFARMPTAVFREEDLASIIRQTVFLAEVASPGIHFTVDIDPDLPGFVCDRRQLGQAFGNLVKEEIFDSIKDNDFCRYFRKKVGFVFQNSDVQLFSPTVFEELAFGPLQLDLSKEEVRSRVKRDGDDGHCPAPRASATYTERRREEEGLHSIRPGQQS